METIKEEDSAEEEVFEMVFFRRQEEDNTPQQEISIEEIILVDEETSEIETEDETVDNFYWKVAFIFILIMFFIHLIANAVFK